MSATNTKSITISPNLLKNFNPFDILEPQKNDAHNLIDFDETERKSHLNASLLDQKAEYELVDLYQNMYVTPQQIKVTETKDNDKTRNKDNNTNKNIDYDFFFDILESGKTVDWSNPEVKITNNISNADLELDRKPNVIETPNQSIEDSDPEDLIEEVIATKNLEKLLFKEQIEEEDPKLTEISNDINGFPKPKVLKPPRNIDFKTLKTYNQSNHKTVREKTESNTNTDETTDSKETHENLVLSFSELNNTVSNSSFADKCTLQGASCKVEGQINNLPTFKVITVKKDEKAYRKYRISKPDSQKTNFTKGADIYEKSIVLPQMMANIMARQTYLANNNNKKKRLVLDSGVKVNDKLSNIQIKDVDKLNLGTNSESNKKCNCSCKPKGTNTSSTNTKSADDKFGEVSPKVLLADCNKERLKALHQSQMFKQFVINTKCDKK